MNTIIRYRNKAAFLVLSIIMLVSCSDQELDYTPDPLVVYPEITVTGFTPATAARGAVVTITGTNFGAYKLAATIWFNTISGPVAVAQADITGYSDTEIKVKVPATAVTGPLTLKVWTHTKKLTDNFIVQ